MTVEDAHRRGDEIQGTALDWEPEGKHIAIQLELEQGVGTPHGIGKALRHTVDEDFHRRAIGHSARCLGRIENVDAHRGKVRQIGLDEYPGIFHASDVVGAADAVVVIGMQHRHLGNRCREIFDF